MSGDAYSHYAENPNVEFRVNGGKMNHKRLFLGSLFLTVGLIAPMAIRANAAPSPQVSVRFYDRDHRDYHNWDDREVHYYSDYRVSHPRYAVEFSRTSRRQQREYWRWRHNQPDR